MDLCSINFTAIDVDSPLSSLTAQLVAGYDIGVPLSVFVCPSPLENASNCSIGTQSWASPLSAEISFASPVTND